MLPRDLEEIRQEVEGYARNEGLDYPEVRFVMLDFNQMNQVAAYDGFPSRYPHWRFGMECERLRKSYAWGLHRIYEMVVNTDPCYAYLLVSNLPIDQKLVMAHVYGHADFFKNNYWFAHTNRRMMEAQIETLKKRFKAAFVPEDDAVIRQTRRELDEYFARKRREFTIPLDYPGTPFETKVWTELLKIPYGETLSYEELAELTSTKGAVRAVGSANGRNRIAIVIPCHRVVNKSGALGGYGGGLWRKQTLLALEQGQPRPAAK